MGKSYIGMALALVLGTPAAAQSFDTAVFAKAKAIQPKVVAWRRDVHEHPELGNSEVRTAKVVADHPVQRQCGWSPDPAARRSFDQLYGYGFKGSRSR